MAKTGRDKTSEEKRGQYKRKVRSNDSDNMGKGKEKLKTEYDSLLGKDIQNQGHRQEGKPSGIPCIDVLNELSEDGRLDRAI